MRNSKGISPWKFGRELSANHARVIFGSANNELPGNNPTKRRDPGARESSRESGANSWRVYFLAEGFHGRPAPTIYLHSIRKWATSLARAGFLSYALVRAG